MKNTCNQTFFCWFYQYHTEPLLIFDPALALSWQLFLFFYIEIIWRLLTVYSSKMYKNVVVRPMGFSFWSFFVFVVFFSLFVEIAWEEDAYCQIAGKRCRQDTELTLSSRIIQLGIIDHYDEWNMPLIIQGQRSRSYHH